MDDCIFTRFDCDRYSGRESKGGRRGNGPLRWDLSPNGSSREFLTIKPKGSSCKFLTCYAFKIVCWQKESWAINYKTPSRLPCYVLCTCMLTKRKFGNQPLDAQQRDNFVECSWLTLDIMGYGGQGGLAIYGVNADTEKLLKVKQHYIFSPFNPNNNTRT